MSDDTPQSDRPAGEVARGLMMVIAGLAVGLLGAVAGVFVAASGLGGLAGHGPPGSPMRVYVGLALAALFCLGGLALVGIGVVKAWRAAR